MDQSSQNSSNHSFSSSSSHSAQNLPSHSPPSHSTANTSGHVSRFSSSYVPHHSSNSASQTSSNKHNNQLTHTNFTNNLNQVLLQSTYASISDTDLKNSRKSFILFDSGAQRSYITESLKSKLNLQVIRTKRIVIKVFGNTDAALKNVDVVNLKVSGLKEPIFVEALVIPEICNSLTNQCSKTVIQENYPHLQGLRFADFSNFETKIIELLIGLDHYYNFVSGNVRKGNLNEPIAID